MKSKYYKVQGIILKRKNLGESDRLYTIFTKQKGKLKAIGKGVRKISSKRRGHLEIFNEVNLTIYTGKNTDYISEVNSIYIPQFDFKSDKLFILYFLNEVVDKLLPEFMNNEYIYNEFRLIISSISNNSENKALIINFIKKILINLGYLKYEKDYSFDELIRSVEEITEAKLKTTKILTINSQG